MASAIGIELVGAGAEPALADVRALLEEYLDWLGPKVCSSTLPAEIASLPQPYGPPHGVLLLARDEGGRALGCVGVRAHEGRACEVKRLYVRRDARRQGVGRALLGAAIEAARALGYQEMLLTTLPDDMPAGVALYQSFGFEDAEAFRHHGGQAADGVTLTFMGRRL